MARPSFPRLRSGRPLAEIMRERPCDVPPGRPFSQEGLQVADDVEASGSAGAARIPLTSAALDVRVVPAGRVHDTNPGRAGGRDRMVPAAPAAPGIGVSAAGPDD